MLNGEIEADKERRKREKHSKRDKEKSIGADKERKHKKKSKHRDETEEEREERRRRKKEKKEREKASLENDAVLSPVNKDDDETEKKRKKEEKKRRRKEREAREKERELTNEVAPESEGNHHVENPDVLSDEEEKRRHKEEKKRKKLEKKRLREEEEARLATEAKAAAREAAEVDDYEDEDYDDDFEDEDFEEEEDQESKLSVDEVEKLNQALLEENEAAMKHQSSIPDDPSSTNSTSLRQSPIPISNLPNQKAVRVPLVSRTSTNSDSTKLKEKHPLGSSFETTNTQEIMKKGIKLSKKIRQDPRDTRIADIRKLVRFETQKFPICDIQPLSAYEVYNRQIMTGNSIKTAYVQTGEDNQSISTQTERVLRCHKRCQWPEDIGVTFSNSNSNSYKDDEEELVAQRVDPQKFSSFLKRTSTVCETLLEENLLDYSYDFIDGRDSTSFGIGMKWIHNSMLLKGRKCVQSLHSPRLSHLILVLYSPSSYTTTSTTDSICHMSLLVLWDLNQTSNCNENPSKILVCEGSVSTGMFSSKGDHIVIAGTSEGSILLWDLRESASLHYHTHNYRYPTYSTNALKDTHVSDIVKIVDLSNERFQSKESGTGNNGALWSSSVQAASLDSRGVMLVWSVLETLTEDYSTNNNNTKETVSSSSNELVDLGLSIGGKVKLVKTSKLSTCGGSNNGRKYHSLPVGSQAYDLEVSLVDSSNFLISTNNDKVLHRSRFGKKATPKVFTPPSSSVYSSNNATARISSSSAYNTTSISNNNNNNNNNNNIDVYESVSGQPSRSISVSPFLPHYFLCGTSAGTVRLYSLQSGSAEPITEFINGSEIDIDYNNNNNNNSNSCDNNILQVQWSPSRPGVFFVLDSANRLLVWDLEAKKDEASYIERFDDNYFNNNGNNDDDTNGYQENKNAADETAVQCISFDLSNVQVETRTNQISLCFTNGITTVHKLSPKLCKPHKNEVKMVQDHFHHVV